MDESTQENGMFASEIASKTYHEEVEPAFVATAALPLKQRVAEI